MSRCSFETEAQSRSDASCSRLAEGKLLEVNPSARHAAGLELRPQRVDHRRRATDEGVSAGDVPRPFLDQARGHEPLLVLRHQEEPEARPSARNGPELVEKERLRAVLDPVVEIYVVPARGLEAPGHAEER